MRSGYVSFHKIYSMKKHVSYTCNSAELIQIGTEQLRNKRIFILLSQLYIYILNGCRFHNLFNYFSYKSTFSELTCAVISIKIDSVIGFEVFITAIYTERDFKSEYLFRMSSVATNLVTSLEFQPDRCVTTLCQFGRTRNGFVATHFILNSTAESSATSGYVVVPECFGQNKEQASRNEERARKNHSFVPSSGFIHCNMWRNANMNFIHQYYAFYSDLMYFFNSFLLWKISWSVVYVNKYCFSEGITPLLSISDKLYPFFSVERWKRRGLWKKKWTERCLSPPESAFFLRG